MNSPRFAKSFEELPDMKEILEMSGMEFMRKMQKGELPAPPIAETLGYEVAEVEDGKVVFKGVPEFKACNPMGTLHGGWYGTLLDSAMSCAVMTKLPKGCVYTTAEYKVNIIRSIPLGTSVLVTGLAAHAGKTTGIAEGRIEGEKDGRLYAIGSATCVVLKLA